MAQLPKVHTVIPCAGIDVGYFSTKFTLGEVTGLSGSEIVVNQFPSFAPISIRKTLPKLGNAAAMDAVIVSLDGVSYIVGKSSLSLSGPDGNVRGATEDYSKTPAYRALLLGALYYMAEHHKTTGTLVINTLVLGLPLNTVFDQSSFLQEMAQGEHVIPSPLDPELHIKVIVKSVIVIAQPQGAMVNYTSGLNKRVQPTDMCLVLDMGGGTFDWFTCNGSLVPSYLLCGAAPVGALACAGAVCEQIKPGLKDQIRTLDKVDAALRNGDPSVRITGVDYEMENYWPLVSGMLSKVLEQMQRQVGKLDGMDHILLTGGGAGILSRVVEKHLADYQLITTMDKDPVFSNVKGFFRVAQMIEGQSA